MRHAGLRQSTRAFVPWNGLYGSFQLNNPGTFASVHK